MGAAIAPALLILGPNTEVCARSCEKHIRMTILLVPVKNFQLLGALSTTAILLLLSCNNTTIMVSIRTREIFNGLYPQGFGKCVEMSLSARMESQVGIGALLLRTPVAARAHVTSPAPTTRAGSANDWATNAVQVPSKKNCDPGYEASSRYVLCPTPYHGNAPSHHITALKKH